MSVSSATRNFSQRSRALRDELSQLQAILENEPKIQDFDILYDLVNSLSNAVDTLDETAELLDEFAQESDKKFA